MNNNITNVFITIDTEHSIGGAFQNPKFKPVGNGKRIYGNVGDKQFGIPLIMDIADQYGLKMVFFVEVLNKYFFGENETREICEYILNRNHEVQLHLHPNFLNFKGNKFDKPEFKDNLFHYTMDEQTRLLGLGKKLLEKYGVKRPLAFRAGNYGFNMDTLTALKKNGFLFDSSYNYAFLRSTQNFKDLVINDAHVINGVFEFPITNFKATIPYRQAKPLDINGVSSREIIHTLTWARETDLVHNITVILHSFSFLEPLDVQYSKVKIRKYVIKRFEELCRFLHEHRDKFKVQGFNDVDTSHIVPDPSTPHFFNMPKLNSLERLGQQILSRVAPI